MTLEKENNIENEDDIETYSPTIRKEKTLKLEGTDYESKIDSITNEEGVIKMRLNEDVIIQRVSNQLYKSSYSAFRELYNNCCYHGYIDKSSYVKVSLDTDTRKFVIQDFNSKGISGVVFNKVLTVLGTSSNTDRSKGGKFGLGFNAYPLLSDVVILETRCVNGETYSVIGKGGMQFQKSAQPNLDKTGTKLSMTLREDINYNRLVDKIIECARTSGVKTYFELKSANRISGFESGLHTLEQESYEEMFEKDRDQSKSYLTSSISNEDYEVHLAIAVNKDGQLTNTRSKNFHLINSPIEVRIDQGDVNTKYYHTSSDSDEKKKYKTLMENYKSQRIDEIRFERVIVNMKNEEMFEARGDREEATEQTEQKLRAIIVSLYNETLKKIKPCEKLEDWFDNEHKYFIASDNQDVLDLIDDSSKPLNKFLNTQVMVYGDKKYKGKQLKYFIEKAEKYFYVHKKDNRVLDLCNENFENFLVMLHPDKDFFKPNRDNSNATLFEDTIKMLENYGFVEAKQYLKDNNIKAKRTNSGIVREKGDIAIHRSLEYSDYWSSGLRTTSSRVKLDSDEFKNLVKENKLIQVTNFALYRSALKIHTSNIQITTQQKELNGIVKTLDDIEKEFTEKTFKTNHGDLNIKEILNFKGKINLNYFGNARNRVQDPDEIERIKKVYEDQIKALPYIPKNELYIFEYKNSDELFLIALLICKKLNASEPTKDILEFQYNKAIINFYENKFKDLENSLTFLGLSNNKIVISNFESIFEYEKFLNKVRDFEMQITDPLIKKFVVSTINFENYEEIKQDALELQEKVKIPKPVQTINRSTEYLS